MKILTLETLMILELLLTVFFRLFFFNFKFKISAATTSYFIYLFILLMNEEGGNISFMVA